MEEELDLPYAYDKVWNTALSTIELAGWNIVHEDKQSGRIEMRAVMDLLTWSEIFYLNLTKIDQTMTRLVMGRAGLAQPLDWGLARQYIEDFLLKMKSNLSFQVQWWCGRRDLNSRAASKLLPGSSAFC